jgi:putative CRISPR-associated protein (TIGR02619 family)
MKKIITTVGTSLLINSKIPFQDLEKDDYADHFFDGKTDVALKRNIQNWQPKLLAFAQKDKTRAAAEIASIEAIRNGAIDDEIYLICTETLASRLVAEVLKLYFGEAVKRIVVVEGLQVKNKERFERKGVIELINELSKIAQNGYYWDDCFFNITGGYKAAIPILTVIAQVKKRPIQYIFEESDSNKYQLIGLPQLPLSIDWQVLFKYSKNFIELHEGLIGKSWQEYKQENDLPIEFDNYYLEVKEGKEIMLGLNGVGYFLMKELENHFFIEVPIGCSLFAEEVNRKSQVEAAIRELYRKLNAVSVPFDSLIDVFLKHTAVEDTWIYKHTQPQVRIQYKWNSKEKRLSIFNHWFINSDIDDKDPKRGYKPQFINSYSALKVQNKIIIGFLKYQ